MPRTLILVVKVNVYIKGDALSTWTGSNLDQVETYTVKATLLGDSLYVTVLDSKGENLYSRNRFNL
jgi:hypothetical protein